MPSSSASKRQRLEELLADFNEEDAEDEQERHQLQGHLDKLSTRFTRAQLALLNQLPRYSRYCQARREALDPEEPTFECLQQHFVSPVLAHRPGPREAHCPPPKLRVMRIEHLQPASAGKVPGRSARHRRPRRAMCHSGQHQCAVC